MSGIASVGQLVAVIQAQFKARAQVAPGQARRPARREAKSLTSLIEMRVAQVDLDDPQRGHKAFRVFLESVLLQELGGQLNTDPRFHQLVEDVQRVMEQDPRCAPLVQDAISHLLAARPADPITGKN